MGITTANHAIDQLIVKQAILTSNAYLDSCYGKSLTEDDISQSTVHTGPQVRQNTHLRHKRSYYAQSKQTNVTQLETVTDESSVHNNDIEYVNG